MDDSVVVQQIMSVGMTVDARIMSMKMFHAMHQVYIDYLTDPANYAANHANHLKTN